MSDKDKAKLELGVKLTVVKDGRNYSAGQQYFVHAEGDVFTLGWAGHENLRDLRIPRTEVESNFEVSTWQR